MTDDLFADTAALVGQLRRGPLAGATYDARGKRRPRTIDRVGLLELLLQADLDPVVRSGLPIAITAARRSDPATLLRLAAAAEVHSLPAPRRFSAGVYAATTCEELDPPWDPSATPPARLAQATARLSSIPDAAFAPFDRETALAGGLVPLCLAWPFPSAPPALPRPPLAGVRTLILAGADDLRTPLENARKVATQLPRASVLTVPGVGHGVLGSVLRGSVVASNARVCVRLAVARFLAAGGGPTRCPPSKPPRPAALPPSSLATLAPVAGVSGKSGRTLRALDLTLDDVAFVLKLFAGRGGGLRGGSVRLGAGGPRLRSFEYIPGVRVSGRPGDRGRLVLRISGPAPSSGTVVLASDGHVRGRLGGRRVSARLTGGPPSPDRRTSTAD